MVEEDRRETVRAATALSWCDGQSALHFKLHLTELPDPDSEGICFSVPNPLVKELTDDDLFFERKR